MPYSNEYKLQEVYNSNIKPVIKEHDLFGLRADDIYHTKPIVDVIWENIVKARIVIAELTGKNPNVFYELGIAHTVGKDVILLTQNIEDVPFDLRHLRVIIYDISPNGLRKLSDDLSGTISNILKTSR